MKEIRQILNLYFKNRGESGVLLTVIKVEGSSYRRTGARMYMTQSGEWIGGISGGCLEADALKKAQISLFQNKPRIIVYDTTQDDPFQIGVGLGCNGIIQILITPIDFQDKKNPLEVLNAIINLRNRNLVFTNLSENGLGKTMLQEEFVQKNPTFKVENFNKNEILKVSNDIAEEEKYLIEIINPENRFLIFGSNADVNPMVKLASELGWLIEIIGNTNKLPNSTKSLVEKLNPKGHLPEIDAFTVAITMCHDFESDYANLKFLLSSKVAYIGLLGPKKRYNKMITRLNDENENLLIRNLDKVYGPAGLDIGADTPEEIAVSVCSEIISVLANRKAGFLRERKIAIYVDEN